MRWYYACKVHECSVFFKGIYTSGNSRTTGLVRPNIQKKIRDIWVHEMILHVKYTKIVYFLRDLYSRELTRGRIGSPGHPSENNRYMRIWHDIMHVEYTNVLYFSRESYFRELTHDWTGSPEHPKENKRYLSTWDDIRCKIHEDSAFSKESILQGTHARPDRFARTSIRK